MTASKFYSVQTQFTGVVLRRLIMPQQAPPRLLGALRATFEAANLCLVATYCSLFTAYIVTLYGARGEWHTVDPDGLGAHQLLARVAIIAHFVGGSLLTLLVPLQCVPCLRRHCAAAAHRWIGRATIASALVVATGGLMYAVGFGTVGGWPMNLAFCVYGLCVGAAAVGVLTTSRRLAQHVRQAAFEAPDEDSFMIAGNSEFLHIEMRRILEQRHRVAAYCLFGLALGSPLYRGYYASAQVYFGYAPPTAATPERYERPFDLALLWLFFVPQLLLVGALHYGWKRPVHDAVACVAHAVATLALVALLVAAVSVPHP